MNVYLKKQNIFWQKVIGRIGLLIFLILFLNIFQSPIRNSFYAITAPFTALGHKAAGASSGAVQSFWQFAQLQQENTHLQEENQHLLAYLAVLQGSIQEYQELQNAIANTKDDSFKLVSARVAGLAPGEDTLIINRGLDDGITKNMPVISSGKVVYGRVVKAYKNFSQVLLISANNTVTDVKIEKKDSASIHGAAKGTGNLSLYLDLVNPDAKIQEGDLLLTSGLEGFFPHNLLVGKIVTVTKNDVKPFQTAIVLPFFNVQNVENVFVVTNYK